MKANIFEYVLNADGTTRGAYLVERDVDNADDAAQKLSEASNYERVYFTSYSTSEVLHMLPDGRMVPSTNPGICPKMYR